MMAMKTYGPIARTFHWGFIGIFLYGIIKQVDDISQLEDSALLRFEVLFALVFLAVLAGRFIYMTKTQTSALPADTSRFQRQAARLVHWGMYASLAAIAITGLMIGGLFSLGFKSGFLIEAVTELHGLTVSLSYLLIALHIAAALYHRILGDGVWSAMTPFWKEQ
jgi:cytochrome b561